MTTATRKPKPAAVEAPKPKKAKVTAPAAPLAIPITKEPDALTEIWATALVLHRARLRARQTVRAINPHGPYQDMREHLRDILEAMEDLVDELLVEVAVRAAPDDVRAAA